MIGQYYGVSVSCNICFKIAQLINVDTTRYRWGQGLEQNAAYIKYIQESASSAALAEGFTKLEDNYVNADGNPINAAVNTRHICPDCKKAIKQL